VQPTRKEETDMDAKDKELALRILELEKNFIAAVAEEIQAAETQPTAAGTTVVPLQRRIALYTAIEAAGPGGISQSELRKAALAAGYESLRDTKVYYRQKGTAHLMKIMPGYRTALTDAGRAWLQARTAA
jgi:hypothetical protein